MGACWVCDKPATYLGACGEHFCAVWGITPFERGSTAIGTKKINGWAIEDWLSLSKANRYKLSKRGDAPVLERSVIHKNDSLMHYL